MRQAGETTNGILAMNLSPLHPIHLENRRTALERKWHALRAEQASLRQLRDDSGGTPDPSLRDALAQNAVEILSVASARHDIISEKLRRAVADLPKMMENRTMPTAAIMGVQFRGYARAILDHLPSGCELHLVPDNGNEYDPTAIKVEVPSS